MKKNQIISIVLFSIFCLLNMDAQTFVKRQGKATDVAISKKDGSVYVVGKSKNVFKYNPESKRFSKFGPQTNDVVKIALSDQNQIYVSKINGSIERSSGNRSWTALNIFSEDVATDDTGKLWVCKKNRGGIVQLDNGSWRTPLKTLSNVSQVAPIDYKSVWVIMNNKSIKKFDNKKWNDMPGLALDIAVDTKTNDVFVIGTSKRIFKWNSRQKKWNPLKNTRRDFVSIDADNGKLWATSTDNSIYEYTSNKPFVFSKEKPKVIVLLHGITASPNTDNGIGNAVNTVRYPQFYWGYDFIRLLSKSSPTNKLKLIATPNSRLVDSELTNNMWSNHQNGVVLRPSVNSDSGLGYILRGSNSADVMCTYRDGGAGLMAQTKAAINQIYDTYNIFYNNLPSHQQPMIYLLSHSFGGIVSRTILTNPTKADKHGVKLTNEERRRADFIRDRTVWLTTLSTPHNGSPLPNIAINGNEKFKDVERIAKSAGFDKVAKDIKNFRLQNIDGEKVCLQDIKDYKFYDNAWLSPENAKRTNGTLVPIYTITGSNPGHTFFLHKRAMGSIFDNSMNDLFDYHGNKKKNRGYHKLGPESSMLTILDILLGRSMWPLANSSYPSINRFGVPSYNTASKFTDALLRTGLNIKLDKDNLVDSDGFVSFTSGHGLNLAVKGWTHFSAKTNGSWYRIYGKTYGESHPWDLDNHRSICYNPGTAAFIGNYLMSNGPNTVNGKWSSWTTRATNISNYKKRVKLEITGLKNLLNEDIGDGFRVEVKIGNNPYGYSATIKEKRNITSRNFQKNKDYVWYFAGGIDNATIVPVIIKVFNKRDFLDDELCSGSTTAYLEEIVFYVDTIHNKVYGEVEGQTNRVLRSSGNKKSKRPVQLSFRVEVESM